jgi:hypothetical protein
LRGLAAITEVNEEQGVPERDCLLPEPIPKPLVIAPHGVEVLGEVLFGNLG